MNLRSRSKDHETSGRRVKPLRLAAIMLTIAVLLTGVSLVALGCGDEGTGPEATVQKFLTAMGNQDIDTLVDLTNTPDELAALEAQGGSKEDLKYGPDVEMIRAFGTMEFTDVEMETQQEGDTAVVTITGGSMKVGGMTLDLAMAGDVGFPTEYDLSMIDGEWYILEME